MTDSNPPAPATQGHTKGPWRWMSPSTLVGDHGRRPVVITASRDRSNIPEMRQNDPADGRLVPLDVNSPDARLIAASPAMLEYLEAVVSFLEDDSQSPRRRAAMLEGARTLIASVRGGR